MNMTSANSDDTVSVDAHAVEDNKGIVYKKTIANYHVYTGEEMVSCAISSRLRKNLVYPTADPSSVRHNVRAVKEIKHIDPLAIGDRVRFIRASDGTGLITEILPRRNYLARATATPMPGAHSFEQVIAANVDLVVAVFSVARPVPKWNMLDRYLVSAESLDLPAMICMTKWDLVQIGNARLETELNAEIEDYRRIGYPLILTSAISRHGLTDLQDALKGRISVFVGKSGVGKTSLLNVLQPGLGLRVGEVSRASGKGKHTTSHLEMFSLGFGGAIIDTPGMREFGLWDVAGGDLAFYFPEMRPYLGCCKFGMDCQHDEEPGCALRKAVVAGKINPRRFQSYLRLKAEA